MPKADIFNEATVFKGKKAKAVVCAEKAGKGEKFYFCKECVHIIIHRIL